MGIKKEEYCLEQSFFEKQMIPLVCEVIDKETKKVFHQFEVFSISDGIEKLIELYGDNYTDWFIPQYRKRRIMEFVEEAERIEAYNNQKKHWITFLQI